MTHLIINPLANLFFGYNKLIGTIPSAFGSLTKLKYLHLSYNQLNGSLDFHDANLSQLRGFYVADNSLTGSIPSFKNFTSLTQLNLSKNLFSGHIPNEQPFCYSFGICTYTHFAHFNLSNNNFSNYTHLSI